MPWNTKEGHGSREGVKEGMVGGDLRALKCKGQKRVFLIKTNKQTNKILLEAREIVESRKSPRFPE